MAYFNINRVETGNRIVKRREGDESFQRWTG